MKPTLVIVDMLKDTFEKHPNIYISVRAMEFVPTINHLSALFREKNYPVIFSCDAFSPDDFIFKNGREPHSIKGTKGAEVIDQLERMPEDIFQEKPKFSAFFRTDLDLRLKGLGIDTVVVAGIATRCVS